MSSGHQEDAGSAGRRPGGSIIVPAHNEAAVIGRTLSALAPLADSGIDLVVVANGCTDATVETARETAPWATVVDSPIPSKPLAIRRGEELTDKLPRLFVDADVVLTATAARSTLAALHEGAVAARPPIRYDTEGASWPVRRYFRARRVMPSVHRHAWGAGVYGLSLEARSRFEEFPDVVGDDLWVDRLLAEGELVVVDTDPVIVTTPRTSTDLIKVLRRGQVTKAEPGAPDPRASQVSTRETARDLRAVVKGPSGAIDALVYTAFALAVRLQSRRPTSRWERDESSRTAA